MDASGHNERGRQLHLEVEKQLQSESREPRESDEWWTPRGLVAEAARWCGVDSFAVDLAATDENTVAKGWFSRDTYNSPNPKQWIEASESGALWCNPPFSKPNLPRFVTTAVKAAAELKAPLCLLVPASTSSSWFHELWRGSPDGASYLDKHDGYSFLLGRVLRFVRRVYPVGSYQSDLLFFDRRLSSLIDGKKSDSARGGHVLVKFTPAR